MAKNAAKLESGLGVCPSVPVPSDRQKLNQGHGHDLSGQCSERKRLARFPPHGETLDRFKRSSFSASLYRWLDVFAKRNGTWQFIVSQGTKLEPPKK
jgi:hypothetical protein